MRRNPDRDEHSPLQPPRTTAAGAALVPGGPAAASGSRGTSMGKWQLTLMAIGTILATVAIIWLGSAGTGHSGAAGTISAERKNGDQSYEGNAPPALETNSRFIERARAIEAGFKAAFLFHR